MNANQTTPDLFDRLMSRGCSEACELVSTGDGFYALRRSISDILATRDIRDFPDSSGERLHCDRYFDDWYPYAVSIDGSVAYGLFKMREQEHDAASGLPADGDTPGVTISFVPFSPERLLECLDRPTDENRVKLSAEINRVVARRGQRHHRVFKKYFEAPASRGAYLVAELYTSLIASMAQNGAVELPLHYKTIVQRSISYKSSSKYSRLPRFIASLNRAENGRLCDDERIYLADKSNPTANERLAILATHTGNTSFYSFAAEVEYHAKFLVAPARITIPFFGRSIYSSAVRADMTIDDNEFEGPAPFYREDSRIVKRQTSLHSPKAE